MAQPPRGKKEQEEAPPSRRLEAFTIVAVLRMLSEARAPAPAHPERLHELVGVLKSSAELSAGMPDPHGHVANLRRAQKAINELRCVLPAIAGFHFAHVALPGLEGPLSRNLDLHLAAFTDAARMLVALRNLDGGAGKMSSSELERKLYGWHFTALLIFLAYRAVVEVAPSIWKTGAAARFISIAMAATGHGNHTPGAVAAVLANHRHTTALRLGITE